MELRRYWRIVRRRLWVVVTLLAVVGAASLALGPRPSPAYQATMRFTVSLEPERGGGYYTYDRYYTWLASEYLVDELTEVVGSAAFAEAVSRELAEEGIEMAAGPLRGAMTASRRHRILTVRITWGDEAELRDIANAAVRALQEHAADFLGQLGGRRADLRLIDPPFVSPAPRSLRERLDLPIRLLLALLAGLALTFLLDYLDDTVRDRAELEAMGLTVLGEIPPLPGRRRFPWDRRLP